MAKANTSNLLKQTPKKKKRKTQADVDAQHIGYEPEWGGTDSVESGMQTKMAHAFNYYAYTGTSKLAKQYLIDYAEQILTLEKSEISKLKAISDREFLTTKCWVARMITMGAGLETKYIEHVNRYIKDLLILGASKKETREQKAKVKQAAPSIYDRVKEQSGDIAAEFEILKDYYFEKDTAFVMGLQQRNCLDILREENANQAHVRIIKRDTEEELLEINSVLKKTDEDLVEGYSCFSKKQLVGFANFLQDIIDACDMIIGESKQTRQPRKKKPVSAEKKAAKMKFAENDVNVNVVSELPVNIVDSTVTFVYNKKTRKLGVYIADDTSGLDVKGQKILNYNSKSSLAKTLRKPKEQLKNVLTSRAKALKFFENEVKTTAIKLNGAMNQHWIIVKTYK